MTVTLELPAVGNTLTATLTDLDGSVPSTAWQWANSSGQSEWQDAAGATSLSYIPTDQDAEKHLGITALYTDGVCKKA